MTRPRVTVVGLGPGGARHITGEGLDTIAEHEHRFLRTARHPSASLLPGAASFDDVYEVADTFDDVYTEITEQIGRAHV